MIHVEYSIVEHKIMVKGNDLEGILPLIIGGCLYGEGKAWQRTGTA